LISEAHSRRTSTAGAGLCPPRRLCEQTLLKAMAQAGGGNWRHTEPTGKRQMIASSGDPRKALYYNMKKPGIDLAGKQITPTIAGTAWAGRRYSAPRPPACRC
jgi:hypothetical protein